MMKHILLVIAFFYCNACSNQQEQFNLQIEHKLWSKMVKLYAKTNGFDYQGLRAMLPQLDNYIKSFSLTKPTNLDITAKIALYLNAYNAFTVRMILRHYGELKSILEIKDKFHYKPWDTIEWNIGGSLYSLNQIEHQILRKQFNEPRIHFALNCASKSCPPLSNKAFTAQNLDTLLDKLTRNFINNSNNVKLDLTTKPAQIELSKIFKWYARDFKPNVINFISKYYSLQQIPQDVKIVYFDYDWDLNDLPD